MKQFMREWGFFILFMLIFGLTRWLVWQPVKVDGHSMDPTLANNERLIFLRTTKINRFDIVVAREIEDGEKKDIVKRVIGMPGDTITYKHDKLYINKKQVQEPYLKDYQAAFAKDKLQSTYSYNSQFQQYAQVSSAFTTDLNGNDEFSVTVPKGEYFLLGDDRIVSKDSREVGTFKRKAIIGEVKFRFWPLSNFGSVK